MPKISFVFYYFLTSYFFQYDSFNFRPAPWLKLRIYATLYNINNPLSYRMAFKNENRGALRLITMLPIILQPIIQEYRNL